MKFSGYCFYMNTNMYWDFQICISVPSRNRRQHFHIKLNANRYSLPERYLYMITMTSLQFSNIKSVGPLINETLRAWSCLGVYHDHARNVSLMNCKTFHFLKTLYFSIYFFIFHLVSIFFFKLILFYTPTKQQKSSDFLCFRGNKKRSMVWKLSISKQNRKLMWINYSDLRNFLGVTLRTVWERFCFAVKFLGKH